MASRVHTDMVNQLADYDSDVSWRRSAPVSLRGSQASAGLRPTGLRQLLRPLLIEAEFNIQYPAFIFFSTKPEENWVAICLYVPAEIDISESMSYQSISFTLLTWDYLQSRKMIKKIFDHCLNFADNYIGPKSWKWNVTCHMSPPSLHGNFNCFILVNYKEGGINVTFFNKISVSKCHRIYAANSQCFYMFHIELDQRWSTNGNNLIDQYWWEWSIQGWSLLRAQE